MGDPFGFSKAIGQQDFGKAPAMPRGDIRDRLNRIHAILCEDDDSQRCRNETVATWNAFNPSNPATDDDIEGIV